MRELSLFCIALLFSSCTELSLEQICVSKIPRFERQVTIAWGAIKVKRKEMRTTRGIASVETTEKQEEKLLPRLDEEDALDWATWSRDTLNEIQKYIDVVDADPNLRRVKRRLMRLANELVDFHGYAEKGNVTRMESALSAISRETESAKNELCGFRVTKLAKPKKAL